MATNTLHFLNEGELIRGISREEVESFSDIPEHLVTDKVILHWIRYLPLDGVPLDRLDSEMRELAVSANPESIKHFNPQNANNYPQLLKVALSSLYFDFNHVLIDEISPEILASAYRKNGDCIKSFMRHKVWLSRELRIDFLNKLITFEPWLLISPSINIDEIQDESIVKSFQKVTDLDFFVGKLVRSGRHRVFDLLAANDHWIGLQKPNNLTAAVWRIMRVDRSTDKADFHLLAAFIRQQPIEEVCAIMAHGKSRQELLVEIFPSQQLLPSIQDMPAAKRHLLSTEFGL